MQVKIFLALFGIFGNNGSREAYHSNGDTAPQLTNMYCPLLYVKSWGFDMWSDNTFPG